VKFKVFVWALAELQAIFIFHCFSRNFGGLYLQLQKGQISFTFGGMGQCSVASVTYRTHVVTLCCGYSIPASEWLVSSAVGIA